MSTPTRILGSVLTPTCVREEIDSLGASVVGSTGSFGGTTGVVSFDSLGASVVGSTGSFGGMTGVVSFGS